MRFRLAVTTETERSAAVADLLRQLSEKGRKTADLGWLFVQREFLNETEAIAENLRDQLGIRHLLGCTASGIVGGQQEFEHQPAVSLLLADLPDVEVVPFRVTQDELEEAAGPAFWHYQLEVEPSAEPNLMLLMDPFSIQSIRLVSELTDAYPDRPMVGGLASGGQDAGQNRLILDEEVFGDGAVGIALGGRVELRTVVSQGCRPIGEPLVVTRADQNVVFELGGRPPIKILQDLLPQLTPRDQQLARTALFLGRVINEYQETHRRGDFLIRNLIGSDRKSGALAVGDIIRPGQTVQFQVRDGEAADEELRALLEQLKEHWSGRRPAGALVFSCLGRGEGMYGVPHHDVSALQQALGPMPAAGLFCNGEIGPVGGRAYIHGFTTVIGLLSEPSDGTS